MDLICGWKQRVADCATTHPLSPAVVVGVSPPPPKSHRRRRRRRTHIILFIGTRTVCFRGSSGKRLPNETKPDPCLRLHPHRAHRPISVGRETCKHIIPCAHDTFTNALQYVPPCTADVSWFNPIRFMLNSSQPAPRT